MRKSPFLSVRVVSAVSRTRSVTPAMGRFELSRTTPLIAAARHMRAVTSVTGWLAVTVSAELGPAGRRFTEQSPPRARGGSFRLDPARDSRLS